MRRCKLALLVSLLAALLAPAAAADGETVSDGCIKFDPTTSLPYYDLDCGRMAPPEPQPAADADAEPAPPEA